MTFNADFYLVAATVIPVLFVALMLPGGALARYAVWVKTWRSGHTGPHMSATQLWRALRSTDLLMLPVNAAIIFGVYGEVEAVLALDHQHASSTGHKVVLISVIGLTIVTGASAMAASSADWVKQVVAKTPESPGNDTT